MKKLFALFCLTSVSVSLPALLISQTKADPAEITSNVQQLSEFHQVIFPMWHNAYPAKDYDALKGFVPQIKAHVDSINNSKLPGILREREDEWKGLLIELNTTAQNYYSAAATNNNDDLLEAAEKLHSVYERMNRVIRPALKEIDDYHQTLYIIYHKLYPEKKYSEIASLAGELVSKAEAIKNYPSEKLKQRLGDKISQFNTSAGELLNVTVKLKEALTGDDPKKKDEAVQKVHTAYQNLDGLFH